MKKTTEEMINDLISSVEDWDIDTLINYVQFHIRKEYENSSQKLIENEWNTYCNELENEKI